MNKATTALVVVISLFVSTANPCFAQTKSKTVRVSCVIPEQVQVSLPQDIQGVESLSIRANQGSFYQTTEGWRINGAERTKLFTVTAL